MSTKLKYPYRWGVPRVQALVENYARGTENLRYLLDLSKYDVRHYLVLLICSGNSLKWESVKLTIKSLDGYSGTDLAGLSGKERKLLYKCLRGLADGDALDLLSYRESLDKLRNPPLFL